MRKLFCLVLILILTVIVSGCGSKNESAGDKTDESSKSNITFIDNTESSENTDSVADKTTDSSSSKPTDAKTEAATGKVDIDMTNFNYTMASAQIAEMAQNKTKYFGKRVKMKGAFGAQEGDSRNYYACVLTDPTACCNSSLEFVLKDTSLKYPADYPSAGSTITVEGTFHSYMEGGNEYFELIDAVLS